MGVTLAFTALVLWGVGDFLMQKSTRVFGDWISLLYVSLFGAVVIFPFVYKDVLLLSSQDLLILFVASFVILIAALLDLEALKQGKISIVEPIYALEIPITAMLAAGFLGEILSGTEVVLIITLMIGVMLLSLESLHYIKNIRLEKGVRLAVAATITMGVVNYLFAVGARETGFLMVNWFTNTVLAIVCFAYLIRKKLLSHAYTLVVKHKKLAFFTSVFDNGAWIAYSGSMALIPAAIATGISEAYIALAALLGLIFNREKLLFHQWVGFFIVIISAIYLAYLVG